ncbi:MAG: hypothetical protein K0S54_888 [Alphaproteobacteria bacterium]|jgi:hypothetical protein|nr:hypothetical protein [Alphaproteobacteria bacterium]
MTETAPAATADDGPKGIGGWLVLPAIGLVVTPFWILITFVRDLLPVFDGETWAMLTTPGSAVYHPALAPLLVFEVVGNIFLIAFTCYVIYLFFTRSRKLPAFIIAWLLISGAIVAIDTFWGLLVPIVAADADASYYKDVIRAVIAIAIWVPYFGMSKRVKNTFVE